MAAVIEERLWLITSQALYLHSVHGSNSLSSGFKAYFRGVREKSSKRSGSTVGYTGLCRIDTLVDKM